MGLPKVTSNCLIMKPNEWPFSYPLPYLQPSALLAVLYSSGSTDLLDFRSPAISAFSLHIVVHETCLQPFSFSYSSFFPFCSFAPQSAFILSYIPQFPRVLVILFAGDLHLEIPIIASSIIHVKLLFMCIPFPISSPKV